MTSIAGDTAVQLALPLGVEPVLRPGIADRFATHHAARPDVYTTLLAMARQWRAQGGQRIGIAALVELARWWSPGIGPLDNTYRAFYARMLAAEPDLAGTIELRRSAADDWWTSQAAA